MLLVFAKLKTNRPFYKRDLLNACTLPQGDRVRFSYRNDWLSKSVNEGGGASLIGKSVLVVFAEEKKDKSLHYHPVRFGKIRNQNRDDGALSFDVELGGFFDYSKYSSAPDDMMAKFQAYVTKGKEQPVNGCFVREDDETYASDSCPNWLPLVQHMRILEGLDQSVFFVMRKGDCSPEFFAPKRKQKDGRDECDVEAGKEYRVAIHAIYGANAKQIVPTLSLSSGLGSMSGPFVKQRSSGAEIDYWVSVKRLFQKDIGMLSVRAIDADDPASVISSDLTWLLRASVSRGPLWATIALIVAGTAIGSLAPEHLMKVGFTEHAVAWSLVAKLVGSVLQGVGVYMGFAKLPVKGPS